jgi:hypothetical protein
VAALLLPVYPTPWHKLVAAGRSRAALIAGLTSQVLAAVLSGNFRGRPSG